MRRKSSDEPVSCQACESSAWNRGLLEPVIGRGAPCFALFGVLGGFGRRWDCRLRSLNGTGGGVGLASGYLAPGFALAAYGLGYPYPFILHRHAPLICAALSAENGSGQPAFVGVGRTRRNREHDERHTCANEIHDGLERVGEQPHRAGHPVGVRFEADDDDGRGDRKPREADQ